MEAHMLYCAICNKRITNWAAIMRRPKIEFGKPLSIAVCGGFRMNVAEGEYSQECVLKAKADGYEYHDGRSVPASVEPEEKQPRLF
jgi:hypothetical protein